MKAETYSFSDLPIPSNLENIFGKELEIYSTAYELRQLE